MGSAGPCSGCVRRLLRRAGNVEAEAKAQARAEAASTRPDDASSRTAPGSAASARQHGRAATAGCTGCQARCQTRRPCRGHASSSARYAAWPTPQAGPAETASAAGPSRNTAGRRTASRPAPASERAASDRSRAGTSRARSTRSLPRATGADGGLAAARRGAWIAAASQTRQLQEHRQFSGMACGVPPGSFRSWRLARNDFRRARHNDARPGHHQS